MGIGCVDVGNALRALVHFHVIAKVILSFSIPPLWYKVFLAEHRLLSSISNLIIILLHRSYVAVSRTDLEEIIFVNVHNLICCD